jgi:hypothetical protein
VLATLTPWSERGCSTLTVSDLVDRRTAGVPLPDLPVVITFYDGFSDTAEIAATRFPASLDIDNVRVWQPS